MQVINENSTFEQKKELFPQILMRIFSVCKNDPDFPLKEQMIFIESEAESLNQKIKKQEEVLNQIEDVRTTLSQKLQNLRQSNFELKSKLLEELGSEL